MMRSVLTFFVLVLCTFSTQAAECETQLRPAIDAAYRYLAGAYACVPLIGDKDVWIGQRAIENSLLSAGLTTDDATIKADEFIKTAQKAAALHDMEAMIQGDVTRPDVQLACHQTLDATYQEYRVAQARLNKCRAAP